MRFVLSVIIMKNNTASSIEIIQEELFMIQQKKIDVNELLHMSRMGLWRIEIEEGKAPRFYADKTMNELIGTPEEMTPEERFVFHRGRIHPEDMQMFLEYSDKLAEERPEIVYRYIHPASGEMFVRCSGIRDMSVKNCISVIGTHQDISETVRLEKEKEAERRLAELNNTLRKDKIRQENYYKELLEMQSCGVLAYTLPGHKVIHMNDQAQRMYGVKSMEEAQQQLGSMLGKVAYPDADAIERLKSLHKVDDVVDYECIIGKGEPNECHVLATTKVIRIPTGERAVITTFLDVSETVVLKNALQKAEEGSRAKSSFLFAMSHDLRTPMNAIIGYAELMERHWGEKELTSDYLQKLKGASQFLLALIGNVLEIARIESGKETLNEAAWNLTKINDILDIVLDREISGKQLTVTRNMEIQHADVYCDSLKIREIIMNLVSNAIKYTPDGGNIDVEIKEMSAVTEDSMILQICVSDTGIGISKKYIPHIFEAFTREKNSSESGIMGTGLGLRIVKSFVELMNGSVIVESELGKGSRFIVEIPCRVVPAEETKKKKNEKPTEVSLQNRRILLVEDNELNAEIAMTVLKDAQAEVELATDGALAVARVADAPAGYYDVVLMDIQMPKMNGYQATKEIRKLSSENSQVPIIAMTANAFEEDRQAALAAGMNDYVAKPIEIEKFLRKIMGVL